MLDLSTWYVWSVNTCPAYLELKVTTMHCMSCVKAIFHWVSGPKISRASLRRQMPTQTHSRWLKNTMWTYLSMMQYKYIQRQNVLECYKTQEIFPHLSEQPRLSPSTTSPSSSNVNKQETWAWRSCNESEEYEQKFPEAYSDHTYLPELVASTNRLTLKNFKI